jgi:hypothetical protein
MAAGCKIRTIGPSFHLDVRSIAHFRACRWCGTMMDGSAGNNASQICLILAISAQRPKIENAWGTKLAHRLLLAAALNLSRTDGLKFTLLKR